MFDLDHFRYYIGNPSAWECEYDDKMSDRMQEAATEIEQLRADFINLRAEMYGEVASRDAKIERLTEALESLTKDPPPTLDEPDTDAEVIKKMRAIARGALEGAATGERQ